MHKISILDNDQNQTTEYKSILDDIVQETVEFPLELTLLPFSSQNSKIIRSALVLKYPHIKLYVETVLDYTPGIVATPEDLDDFLVSDFILNDPALSFVPEFVMTLINSEGTVIGNLTKLNEEYSISRINPKTYFQQDVLDYLELSISKSFVIPKVLC